MATITGPVSQEYIFGAGRIFAVNNGNGFVPSSVPQAQPVQFLSIQEASVEEAITIKPLDSNYEFPDSIASADRKLTGKVTFGRVDLLLLNQIVFGESSYAVGGTLLQGVEAEAVPSATPWTVTVTNSATFVTDLGVYYADTGEQFVLATTPSAAGEYSVAAGVYTFDTADASANVLINYTYTDAATGHSLTVTTQVMGLKTRPAFSLYLSMPSQGNSDMVIYNCRASKLNRPIKRDDYLKIELDFEAYPNAAGQVYTWASAIS